MGLILASASKQRLALLQQIAVTPTQVFPCDIDESIHPKELPRQYTIRMAQQKAAHAHQKFPNDYVLAGDTVIACGRRILGKPADRQEAGKQLRLLSGRAHRAYSAVCLIAPDSNVSQRINMSRVSFKPIASDELEIFLASDEWCDRAGSYHIYGLVQKFIRNINGSPSAIAGLPLYETAQLLRGAGLLSATQSKP